ncbi:MAG: DUF559 domain-containing protein [Jatrophihabitans sp.]
MTESSRSAAHRDVYALPGTQLDAVTRAGAARQRNKGAGALAGWSAATIPGVVWSPEDAPAEVSRTHHVRSPRGIVVRNERLCDDEVVRRHHGARGIVRLRQALSEADAGAESPWETRTRLAVIRAGLPRPLTQVQVRARSSAVIARLDLGWPQWRVGLEYDGAQHWLDPDQRSRDLSRGNALTALGWTVLRVNAAAVRSGAFLPDLSAALRLAGAPPP